MGMLGALAGFGQGLQDYSKVLQKKQEQDWLDQQARVKYEREENLSKLQIAKQEKMQQAGFTHAENLDKARRESDDARWIETQKHQQTMLTGQQQHQQAVLGLQQKQLDISAANKAADDEYRKNQPGRETTAKLDLLEGMNKLTSAKNKKEAEDLLKTFEDAGMLGKLSKEQQAILQTSAQYPERAPHMIAILKADRDNKMPPEVAEKIAVRAGESYDAEKSAKDQEPRELFLANFQKANPNVPPTESNLRYAYTMEFASNEKKVMDALTGRGTSGSSLNTPDASKSYKPLSAEEKVALRQKLSPEGLKIYIDGVKKINPEDGARLEREMAVSEHSSQPQLQQRPANTTWSQYSGLTDTQLKKTLPQKANESWSQYQQRLKEARGY